jgi:diacylglycerol kinase family enzyme
MPPMTATLVLLNPRAAGGRAAALQAPVRDWLAARAPEALLVVSDSVERALATLLALPPESRVAVIGGDGTLQQMLPALLARRHTLALAPFGSGNDSARALGVHAMSWEMALQHGLHAPAALIDTGELSSARRRIPFLSSLCAGFDAAVCARAAHAPAWLGGMARYLWSTFAELAALRTWDLRVTVDGALRHTGPTLFASTCNTPTFGGGMPAVPAAVIDDARLDLLLAGDFGRAGTLWMLPRLLRATHLRDARVATWSYATLHVSSTTPIPLAADGEPLQAVDEFEIRIRPKALSVVIGPGRAALHRAPAR